VALISLSGPPPLSPLLTLHRDPACEVIEEFLSVEEFVNMDRIFARDAGLVITARDVVSLL
jgi:hypothetical protein